MTSRPVFRVLAIPAILALASCANGLYLGRDHYAEGMRRLRYDPASADPYFTHADRNLAEAIEHDELDPQELVLAVTMRARSLIELERYPDVASVLATPIPTYDPQRSYRGDSIALSLLRASKLDPERAYAELLLAEKKASTLRSRVYLAWEQVHLLQKIGSPKAKAEAIKICDAHAGNIDFDTLKKSLAN